MNRLLIALALLFVAAVCQAQVETGSIDCGYSVHWARASHIPNRPNVGERTVHVKFSGNYSKPPNVFLSISELDIDQDSNLRMTTDVVSVSTTGFIASCVTWDNTIVYSMKLHWISIYDNSSSKLVP